MDTTIVAVDPTRIGSFIQEVGREGLPDDWRLQPADTDDYARLQKAAQSLRTSNCPVAFPTETVYGLGADATRSDAVKGIYRAKQRPSDNPLIVHFASVKQIETTLGAPIPPIYHVLIKQYWPGPLTILLPLPKPSPFAPEISAGLSTFGARIPRNAIALALIQLTDRPIAAPSANASTKPSPTAAEHVLDDLDGRIELIVDGGPCDVGVESTVVDGLSDPPAILRPGGISLQQIRACVGWESCIVGYKDKAEHDAEGEANGEGPRAPGMKYRHYSPKAKVFLYEIDSTMPTIDGRASVGVVRTAHWTAGCGARILSPDTELQQGDGVLSAVKSIASGHTNGASLFQANLAQPPPKPRLLKVQPANVDRPVDLWDVDLGADLDRVARGLFSALRELDRKNVDLILVEGVDDRQGELAAAIMNRLRKASSVRVSD